MQFLVAVYPHGLTERSKIGERQNRPATRWVVVWCFVVGAVDLVGSLEETPRDTHVAAESFVPANAFLFGWSLLDQKLSAS